MIFRFGVLLPYEIVVSASEELNTLTLNYLGADVTIYPPMQFSHIEDLVPRHRDPPEVLRGVRLGGSPAQPLDLLMIDIQRHNLERPLKTAMVGASQIEAVEMGFGVIDLILGRLRALTGSPIIRPVNRDGPYFFLFLSDEKEVLPPDPILVTRALSGTTRFQEAAIDVRLWNAILDPAPELPLHRILLFEAQAISPETAAIVLAFSAVEAATKLLIAELSLATLPRAMADWVGDGQRMKGRTIENLLRGKVAALTGRRLAEENPFWLHFKDLVHVRNNLVHGGKATLHGVSLKNAELDSLLRKAETVVAILESLLPSGFQLQGYGGGTRDVPMDVFLEAWHQRKRIPLPETKRGTA